jgi:hypothetical protein
VRQASSGQCVFVVRYLSSKNDVAPFVDMALNASGRVRLVGDKKASYPVRGISRRADLKTDPVLRRAAGLAGTHAHQRKAARSSSPKFEAHVARAGAMNVGLGEWIGGPENPMRVEGLSFDLCWQGLGLAYCVTALGLDGVVSESSGADGSIVGTRRKASAIVGPEFALTGPAAGDFEIECEALFLGSAVQARTGKQLKFQGLTRQEALVGIRFARLRDKHQKVHQSNTGATIRVQKWDGGAQASQTRGLQVFRRATYRSASNGALS